MISRYITGAVALAAMAVAMPASAATYLLGIDNGSKVTINTDTMIGTWIGSGINATFSGAGLANFSASQPSFESNITIAPTSTITGSNGTVYSPNQVHQQVFKTGTAAGGANQILLWSWWGTAACPNCQNIGDYAYTILGSRTVLPGTPGSGTEVPEPGMAGLLGLGMLGLAFARRRRTKVSLKLLPAAA